MFINQDEIINDYGEEDKETINMLGISPRFYSVHFKNKSHLEEALSGVCRRSSVFIEDEEGRLLSSEQFLDGIKECD